MILGVDPKVDYAFKKLFGCEVNISVLLLDLLDAVLRPPPDERIVAATIINPFNEKETLGGKSSILDIKARDQAGSLYNVEMEMEGARIYPQRALYYWAVLHGSQLSEGEHYSKLRPTISISFVNTVLFPTVPDYHLDFQLRSSRHPQVVFSPQQAVHVLELPKFKREAHELADPLDRWCYFLKHAAELDPDNLPETLHGAALQRAIEVLQMLKQSEIEWHQYQDRLKWERDRASEREELEEARAERENARAEREKAFAERENARAEREKAFAERENARAEREKAFAEREKAFAEREEAFAEREKAHDQGDLLGRIHVLQNLLHRPITAREELLALPMADLQVKAAALEQEVADRLQRSGANGAGS